MLPGLLVGNVDLVVGRLPEIQEVEGVEPEVLYYEPVAIVACTGHPLAQHPNLTLQDLVNEQWILPSPGTTLRREIDNAFHKSGLPVPSNVIESVSILTNRTLLMETDMIAAMPYQVIRTYEEIGLLCQLPVTLKADAGPVGVSTRSNTQLTPAANYLLELLREVGAEMQARQPAVV